MRFVLGHLWPGGKHCPPTAAVPKLAMLSSVCETCVCTECTQPYGCHESVCTHKGGRETSSPFVLVTDACWTHTMHTQSLDRATNAQLQISRIQGANRRACGYACSGTKSTRTVTRVCVHPISMHQTVRIIAHYREGDRQNVCAYTFQSRAHAKHTALYHSDVHLSDSLNSRICRVQTCALSTRVIDKTALRLTGGHWALVAILHAHVHR
jgi:hypothetical protein